MKKLLCVLSFLFIAHNASAQTPIIIGPSSTLNWDLSGLTPSISQTCTHSVSVGSGPFNAITSPVTCVALGTADSTCSTNLVASGLPLSSASIRMTITCSTVTSLPSTAFAYVVIVIPVPTNLRIKH